MTVAKPETKFIGRVHAKLPNNIYHMKNSNPYTGGIPDVWYSGPRTDLWVEYKWLPKKPVTAVVDPLNLLSALQAKWLNERANQGRNVAVIIGCPGGGVVLTDYEWKDELNAQEFNSLIESDADLAKWVAKQVT